MVERPRVMLVDDDPGLLRLLSFRLRSAGFEVAAVDSGAAALAKLPVFKPQVVITDLRMDGMDGLTLFDTIHADHPTLPVIILTAHGTIPEAVAATQRGLHGFFTKPCDSDRLLESVRGALRVSGVEDNSGNGDWDRDIITRSPTMQSLLERARLAARSDAAILIVGDSGSGKATLARTIHSASARADRDFVSVDCTASSDAKLEAELFGDVEDLPTTQAGGMLRQAHGGTLFLGEVGDLSLALQARLLRALRDKETVGEQPDEQALDVRVISATRNDLERASTEGEFREELFYRLNVVNLHLPALAQRREDIPLLARHFLGSASAQLGRPAKELAPDAMDALLTAPWPGNVRQLRNVIEQAVALSTSPVIPKSLLVRALDDEPGELPTLNDARSRFERQYLVRVLRSTQGNVSQAARLAGRDRSKFYKLLRRHELDPVAFRTPSQSVR